jgi:hypothetical protein
MTVVAIADFSGMMPLRDPVLLPDNYSQYSENAWLYKGAIRGFRTAPPVYTIKYPATTKQVYRIPLNDQLEDWANSLWLEFPDPYMKVIRNPTVGDIYDRYYFFPSVDFVADSQPWLSVPFYAPLANIKVGGPYYILGIPVPTVPPIVVSPIPSTTLTANAQTLPGGSVLNFASTIGVSAGQEVSDATNTVVTINTSALTAIGSSVLNFASTTGVYVGMTVYDTTNPAAITSTSTVISVSPTSITINNTVLTPGVSSGDAIQFTNSNVISGGTTVVSFTLTTVTINQPVLYAGVLTGSQILFNSVAETRAYVYTYVSFYNEEGPPSPATIQSGNPVGTWTVTVYSPTAAQQLNRNLAYINIYRTVTDSAGNSTFYQVAERLPITTPEAAIDFIDAKSPSQITNNLILATTVDTSPPAGLDCVVMMANGIMAGTSNEREIWFSSAFKPWSWPATYALTVDYPVVGQAAIGSMLNILTEGQPFIASGTTPDTMTIGKVTANEPCISRGSIFSAGEGVYYASPNGLILLNTSGTINTTQFAMEREFWESLSPEKWASGRLGLSYNAFVKGATSASTVQGVVLDHLEKNVPCTYIEPLLEVGETLLNCYWDETSGQIFQVHSVFVRQWMPSSGGALYPYVWKSKKYRFPRPESLKAVKVSYTVPPEVTIPPPTPASRNNDQNQVFNPLTQYLIVRVYADGEEVVVREVVQTDEILLVPEYGRKVYWEVQFEGQINLFFFKMATTVKELRKA